MWTLFNRRPLKVPDGPPPSWALMGSGAGALAAFNDRGWLPAAPPFFWLGVAADKEVDHG